MLAFDNFDSTQDMISIISYFFANTDRNIFYKCVESRNIPVQFLSTRNIFGIHVTCWLNILDYKGVDTSL